MANLSNINNKFIVTDGGNVLIGSTVERGIVTIDQLGVNTVGLVINSTSATYPPYLYLRDQGGAGYSELQANNDLYINCTNVGIGTDSPTEKLHIKSTTSGSFIRFEDNGGSGVYVGSRSDDLEFYAGNSEKMVILSGGNVGIGETNPTYKFEVRGSGTNTLQRWTTTEGGALLLIPANNAANPDWTFIAGTNEDIQIDPANNDSGLIVKYNGNVGIGVTSPQAKLDITGTSTNDRGLQIRCGDVSNHTDSAQIILSYAGNSYNSSGYAHSIRTRHNSGLATDNAIDFFLWSPTDTASTLGTKRVMTLEGTGNVGIGTTSPDAKLHIYGSSTVSEMYLGEDAAADKAGILKYTQGNGSGTGVVTLSHWGNNSLTEGLAVKYGGNVGIGTTGPDSKLQIEARNASNIIYGGFRVGYNATSNNYYDADTHHFRLGTGSSAGGNLMVGGGIYLGGTAAANKLDHYEEGTWTPGLTDGSGNQVTSGTYTRIGRSITISGLIIFNSQTSSTQFTITTFPFTVNSADGARGGISVSYSTSSTFMTILMDNSSTNARVWGQGATGNPTLASLSGKRIYFGGTYQMN